jgi:multidrug efflux system outer membrane protein
MKNRILFVEDNPILLQAYELILGADGAQWDVSTASNARTRWVSWTVASSTFLLRRLKRQLQRRSRTLERQIAFTENRLRLLIGPDPRPVARARVSLAEELRADVPPELSLDLLRRRPEVLEAEQTLRAANAQVGWRLLTSFPD